MDNRHVLNFLLLRVYLLISVLRVWDVLLFEGNRVMLFRTALALMDLYGMCYLDILKKQVCLTYKYFQDICLISFVLLCPVICLWGIIVIVKCFPFFHIHDHESHIIDNTYMQVRL